MLRARDVWEEQEERRANRMAAMNPIIAQIQAQIKRQAVHNSNAPYIIYPVPTYVFGYPLFTLKEALDHLVAEFSKAGYWVWVVENNTALLISWLKPVKTRDGGKPMLATNYRPQIYGETFMPQNR